MVSELNFDGCLKLNSLMKVNYCPKDGRSSPTVLPKNGFSSKGECYNIIL